MDSGTHRSPPPGERPKPRESRDPLVRKYVGYRAARPAESEAGPTPRPAAGPVPAGSPHFRPDRGLRSKRAFGRSDDELEPIPASSDTSSPHGVDPAWFLRRPWKSASRKLVPLAILLGGAWVALSLTFGTNGLVRLWELRAKAERLDGEFSVARRDHQELLWELHEPAPMALERSAREKYDLQRPGEIIYRFPRTSTDSGTALGAPGSEESSGEDGADVDMPEAAR